MNQRNWIVLAAVIVVLIIIYAVWPSDEPGANAPEATQESTE
ncbi:hypothetical protein [Mesorhizobium xinjiangense]|nr:hypothetical protein [Mesorhizobium xinjiangense]